MAKASAKAAFTVSGAFLRFQQAQLDHDDDTGEPYHKPGKKSRVRLDEISGYEAGDQKGVVDIILTNVTNNSEGVQATMVVEAWGTVEELDKIFDRQNLRAVPED